MNTKSFRTLALGPLFLAAVVGLGVALSGCVVDTTPNGGYGYGCQSDLYVDWQIQNVAGGSVTCDAINPAQVVIDIDGAKYPQTCPAGYSYGNQDILSAVELCELQRHGQSGGHERQRARGPPDDEDRRHGLRFLRDPRSGHPGRDAADAIAAREVL